jgi:hypothetical protein
MRAREPVTADSITDRQIEELRARAGEEGDIDLMLAADVAAATYGCLFDVDGDPRDPNAEEVHAAKICCATAYNARLGGAQ